MRWLSLFLFSMGNMGINKQEGLIGRYVIYLRGR